MVTLTAQRRALLDSIADEFLHHNGKGRTLLAVDGVDGVGKTRFADDLAHRLGRGGHAVFRASIDDFHRPRALRYLRGKDSPEGFYLDSYDYDLFRRVLVNPFKLGGSAGFVTAGFDLDRDVPRETDWKTGPQDATLVVDGIFLNRPALRGLWNYSIWLEAEPAVIAARLEGRDGPTALGERYIGGEVLYLEDADPRAAASAIIDNTDLDHPRREFADSC
jgi:uridine kinase